MLSARDATQLKAMLLSPQISKNSNSTVKPFYSTPIVSHAPRSFALGLGGNVGDVRSNIQNSISVLQSDSRISELRVSSLYQTPPWGDVEGGEFVNAAVSGKWTGTDLDLLYLCRSLEDELSVPVEKNGAARALDVDVLFLQGGVSSKELTLPHPRMSMRRFVLVPLCDVWSEKVPGFDETPAALLKRVPDSSCIIFPGSLSIV